LLEASAILKGTGSVWLEIIYWMLGGIIFLSTAAVYLDFASYFPSRSGAEVVYLEQVYPRSEFFFPTTFAMQNVILSFTSSNAIGMSARLHSLKLVWVLKYSQSSQTICSQSVAPAA
jgi:hypothetical protein